VCTGRYLTPNFYYDMVDYCRGRVAAGAPWSWSSLLPNPVIGYSPSSFMNLLNAVAGYAVICRELGLPLRWSGGIRKLPPGGMGMWTAGKGTALVARGPP